MGASTSTGPSHFFAYNATGFPPLPQVMNTKGVTASPTEISPRVVMLAQALHLFPTYALGSTGTNTADPYAPQNLIHDPIILVVNPIIIAYIIDMVSRQVQQHEGETNCDPNHHQTLPCWVK